MRRRFLPALAVQAGSDEPGFEAINAISWGGSWGKGKGKKGGKFGGKGGGFAKGKGKGYGSKGQINGIDDSWW